MSFLSTLGKILSVGEEVVGVFFPVLKPFLGSGALAKDVTTGVNDFTQIGSVIVGVEAAFQTPGSMQVKLQAALPQVANIVRTSEMLINHKVANEPEFIAGVQDLVNAFVRITNAYSDSNIKSSGTAIPINVAKSAPVAAPTPVANPIPKVDIGLKSAPFVSPTLEEDKSATTQKSPNPLALG